MVEIQRPKVTSGPGKVPATSYARKAHFDGLVFFTLQLTTFQALPSIGWKHLLHSTLNATKNHSLYWQTISIFLSNYVKCHYIGWDIFKPSMELHVSTNLEERELSTVFWPRLPPSQLHTIETPNTIGSKQLLSSLLSSLLQPHLYLIHNLNLVRNIAFFNKWSC